MLNVDPLLFQPKVIRVSSNSIGQQLHIIRNNPDYNNLQVMTATTAHVHNEANNNILTSNDFETSNHYTRRTAHRRNVCYKDNRNYNNMDPTTLIEQDMEDRETAQQIEWTAEQMYWSGEGSDTLERLSQHPNTSSIMSFQSNLSSPSSSTASASFHSQLEENSESKSQEEVISSLLQKVRSQNKVEASKILLTMSSSVENCILMRQCGCLPLLVQLLHSPDENSNTYHLAHAKRVSFEVRERASQVLHNVVFSQPDDKKGRREARVLKLLEQVRDYCDTLRSLDVDDNRNARCVDQHLGPSVAALMKLSFDEDHRHAMCQLGGLQAIAELLQTDQDIHGCTGDQYCITIRRYSGMALTNLTFGDGANKALLASMRPFMEALVAQLYSPSEDLRQVTASVLRNLSWRADPTSKRLLREVGTVTVLVKAAMEAEKESTLKSILSALWNLSAHCSANKADICHVDGALAFLVSTLVYKSKSKTLAIVENGGGILRNVSSHIAIQNDYRAILRKHNCLQILLQHLKSPSLTVVSNACGTLWNLSARNATDQRMLWEMGAVGMLKKLINSKHKMISMGSSAALKNLLSAQPPGLALGLSVQGDGYLCGDGTPSLMVRKQKALSAEIDQNLSETYDNTDSPKTSPVKHANQDTKVRSRRHISPSAARYLANQKLKNELSLPNRERGSNKETDSYVVEEKHNGAFQVTKNAKQALNYKQGQLKTNSQQANVHTASSNETPKLSFRPARVDKPMTQEITSRQIMPNDVVRNGSSRSMSPFSVRNDIKSTNSSRIPESSIPMPTEAINQKQQVESRIPLPKTFNKVDSKRSQSASPVAQRRNIPQRQPENTSSKKDDVTVTHPKCAWTASPEKEDSEPEKPVNFSKRFSQDYLPATLKPQKLKLKDEDIRHSNDDEVKVYRAESASYHDDSVVKPQCSLNIKTSTKVRMIKNHPLLANASANRGDSEGMLFTSRRSTEGQFQDLEGGKTVDFSVQSDYDIDEPLSLMSRSSSVASLGSFDKQSFHEDESFASDISHHTSGAVTPIEDLSDTPCETAPTSPQGSSSNYITLCGDHQQTHGSSATERIDPESSGEVYGSIHQHVHECEDIDDGLMSTATDGNTIYVSFDESDSTFQLDDQSNSSKLQTSQSAQQIPTGERIAKRLVSRSSSSGSFGLETAAEYILPVDEAQLDERGKSVASTSQGVRQKIPQLSYQLLKDSVERHPRACSFEGERGTPKTLEIKETEYESLSENEEKGKEDERKAEKNRLFRIPESPVDKTSFVVNNKMTVDLKGNRRPEKHPQEKNKDSEKPSVSIQLEFLMSGQNTNESRRNAVEKDLANDITVSEANGYVTDVNKDKVNISKIGSMSIERKAVYSETTPEKDIDCSERENSGDSDENMMSSTVLNEAKEIAEALLCARVDSTEDMTVSTLSCLSDIDNAGPPSVMADMGCLSITNSSISEENLKMAVARECQKLFGKSISKNGTSKKSLLRELQIGRLTVDEHSRASIESGDNSSMKSSCTDLLGNVNPPSALDDMSLTSSLNSIGSDSECEPERNLVGRYASNQDSMSERMHEAAAIAQLYAKELSNITGNIVGNSADAASRIKLPTQDVMEVTIADVTEIGCDTIGSDTEYEDDLPCDDEELESETIQVRTMTRDDGSSDNLTATLTDEPQNQKEVSPYLDFQKFHGCFMTSEEFRALQENADMILNTLKDIEISDEENGEEENSQGDMLEDETMSLVSNESDEEALSPDGNHQPRISPRAEFLMSPTCNGMIGLPQNTSYGTSKVSTTKTNVPLRNKFSALPKSKDSDRYSYQSREQQPDNGSKPHSSYLDLTNDVCDLNEFQDVEENGRFDSRTFTRKQTSIPREMVPTISDNSHSKSNKGLLKSPSSANGPSFPCSSGASKPDLNKVSSKIAGVWKNNGKARSKSAGDINRNSKLRIAPSGSPLHRELESNGSFQRLSSQTPSPKNPLSRSNTFEDLSDEETSKPSIRRPSSLSLAQKTNSPRHVKGVSQTVNAYSQKAANDDLDLHRSLATEPNIKVANSSILSPSSHQSSSNIPKVQNKAPISLIPSRRSMIPTPAKFGNLEN